jgi:cytochrome b involved in lipid metabolism
MTEINEQAEMKAELDRLRREVATLKLAEQGKVSSNEDGGFSPSFLEANFGIHEQPSGHFQHNKRRGGINKALWLLLLVGVVAAMLALGATMASGRTQVVQEEPSAAGVAAFNQVEDTQVLGNGADTGVDTRKRSGRSGSSESSEDSSDEMYTPVAPTNPSPTRAPVPAPTSSAANPSPTRAPVPAPTSSAAASCSADPNCVTRAELQRHNSAGDCWLAFHGKVYALTSYAANDHPGGARVITNHCGTDGTSAYAVFHKAVLLRILPNSSFQGSLEGTTRGGRRKKRRSSGSDSSDSEDSDDTNNNPAPTPDPSPDSQRLPTRDPSPLPTPDPSPDPTPSPVSNSQPSPTPDPTPRPVSNSQPSPTRNPTPDPTPGPTPNPTPGPTPDPTPGPTPNPTPGPTPDPTPGPTPNPTPGPTPVQSISSAQLQSHSSAGNCWVAIHGNVYDLTTYANDHPGGARVITNLCGTDGTTMYNVFHDAILLNVLLTDGELQGPFGN